MAQQDPELSVVVLSYQRPHLLEQALASIMAQAGGPTREVLLVDNASPRTAEVRSVAARFPGVRAVYCAENGGFTGGMRRGATEARGRFLYLTEDDVLLEPGCLAALHRFAAGQGRLGLCGPVMVDHETGGVRCSGGRIRLEGGFPLEVDTAPPADATPYRTGYLPGAAWWVPKAVWEGCGGLREDFFMYLEDVEFCWRLAEADWGIWVVPEARVRHFEPPSGPGSPVVAYHKLKNLAATYVLHGKGTANARFFLRTFPGLWLAAARSQPGRWRAAGRAALWLVRQAGRLGRERGQWRRRRAGWRGG